MRDFNVHCHHFSQEIVLEWDSSSHVELIAWCETEKVAVHQIQKLEENGDNLSNWRYNWRIEWRSTRAPPHTCLLYDTPPPHFGEPDTPA